MSIIEEALTFDDVLLVPQFSEVQPSNVSTNSLVTKSLKVHIPLLSSAMDTVTESKLAIKMAQHGGVGIIHKNLSFIDQAEEVKNLMKESII